MVIPPVGDYQVMTTTQSNGLNVSVQLGCHLMVIQIFFFQSRTGNSKIIQAFHPSSLPLSWKLSERNNHPYRVKWFPLRQFFRNF